MATATSSQALNLVDPRTLLGQWFEDHRTGARYYVSEENGLFFYVFQDGTRLAWPSPQDSARSPRYVVHAEANVSSDPAADGLQIRAHRARAYNRQDHGAVPRSQIVSPQHMTEAFWQLNVDPTQEYWNVNGYQDRSGTAPRPATETHMIPGLQLPAHRTLRGTPGVHELLDPSFKKRQDPGHFFKIGKVFLVLWPEPAGHVDDSNRSEVTEGLRGEYVCHKIRRFVVIREGTNSCSAVAILTYGHQGVAKRGTIKSEHAIAHTGRLAPSPLPSELPVRGEEGMREPVRIDPFTQGETLVPESRINFGKVYTIEHYVKVKGFGVCTSPAELEVKFDAVWNRRPLSSTLPGQMQQRPRPSRTTYAPNLPPSSRTNSVANSEIARTPGSAHATSQRTLYRATPSTAHGYQPRPVTRSLSHGQATAAPSAAAYRNVARRQHASSRGAIIIRNNSASDSCDSTSSEEESDD